MDFAIITRLAQEALWAEADTVEVSPPYPRGETLYHMLHFYKNDVFCGRLLRTL